MPAVTQPPAAWSALLVDAVKTPGIISSAYNLFWHYSSSNQLLTWFQCIQRGLDVGPINTFVGWRELGRTVKKGEKALTLCMPVQVKRRSSRADRPRDGTMVEPIAGGDGAERPPATATAFVYKPHWFVLSQTEGQEFQPIPSPEWNEVTALHGLGIDRIPFRHADGNCQGYAIERQVAVSPIAFLPHRTLFHEIAHVVLGHTEELIRMDDSDRTPKNIREVEAECVALICNESLGLPGAEFSRGYVQHWLAGEVISDKSAQRIFKAADRILKAGYPQAGES